ncbi:DUF6730 family protein [Salinimicrobium terrae]|uniref:DUF6730 family protein n=1 Tax=Salinimicrobium terrae TaxID=470866 RepID=UPI003CCBC7F8
MTKLEELSEMLVSEIDDFKETVKKLEEIRKSKIQLDLQNLPYLLTEHQQSISWGIEQNQRYLEIAEKRNNQTKAYLRKGFILVAVGFLLNLLSVAVTLYLTNPGLDPIVWDGISCRA